MLPTHRVLHVKKLHSRFAGTSQQPYSPQLPLSTAWHQLRQKFFTAGRNINIRIFQGFQPDTSIIPWIFDHSKGGLCISSEYYECIFSNQDTPQHGIPTFHAHSDEPIETDTGSVLASLVQSRLHSWSQPLPPPSSHHFAPGQWHPSHVCCHNLVSSRYLGVVLAALLSLQSVAWTPTTWDYRINFSECRKVKISSNKTDLD